MKTYSKLTFICLDQHFEIVNSILLIMSFNTDDKVNVITSKESCQGWDHSLITKNTHFITVGKRARDLEKCLLQLDDPGHIIIVSLDKRLKTYYDISLKYSTSIISHNTHYTFSDRHYRLSLNDNPYKVLKNILLNTLFQLDLYKKKLLGSCENILFLSEHVLDYAKKKYPAYLYKLKYLPYHISMTGSQTKNKSFTLVLPGGINQSTRDHQYLFKWLKTAKLNIEVKLIFLGRSMSISIQETDFLISQLKNNLIRPYYFDYYVDQNTYDAWMKEADLVLSDVREEIYYTNYIEKYGITKVSGSIHDAIRFKKPLLIPAHYPILNFWKSFISTYQDYNEFINILESFIQKKVMGINLVEIPERYENRARLYEDLMSAISLDKN